MVEAKDWILRDIQSLTTMASHYHFDQITCLTDCSFNVLISPLHRLYAYEDGNNKVKVDLSHSYKNNWERLKCKGISN